VAAARLGPVADVLPGFATAEAAAKGARLVAAHG
jgi:hypothetical protein